MASIADLFFSGRLDDGPLQVDAKKAGDEAGRTIGQRMSAGIKKSSSELKGGLLGGLGLAGGLGIANLAAGAVHGVTESIFGAIDAASDLNETVSKSNVIFGKNAKAVEAWGDTAATEFGQSKRAALDTASTFAGLLSTVGLTLDDATDKSKALTKLGSDLASFFNSDVAEATQALRSGLSGESEPLRRFNIFLSDAAVQAKATALGMKKVNGQLTEGQKVTARYAIIMDQSTSAQGDFARTSDGLANKQRILSARMEDAAAKIGQALLPVMLKLSDVVLDDVVPAIEKIAPALQTVLDVAGNVAGGIEYLGETFNDFLDFVTPWDGTEHEFEKIGGRWRKDLNTTGDSLKDVADKGGRAADDLVNDFGRVERAGHKLRVNLLADATKIVDDYFDVLIAEDELAATNAEINALRKIAASRNLTSEEIANLHRLERTQAQLESDLASHGATQSKQFKSTMADLLKRLQTAHGAEKRAIEAEILQLKLLAIAAKIANGRVLTLNESIGATLAKGGYINAAGSGSGHSAGGVPEHRASGGAVAANTAYIVGEKRPELFVPDVDGMIVPRVAWAQPAQMASPGGDTYQVNLLDRMEVRSVRDIGSGLRMLGEQGHLVRKARR